MHLRTHLHSSCGGVPRASCWQAGEGLITLDCFAEWFERLAISSGSVAEFQLRYMERIAEGFGTESAVNPSWKYTHSRNPSHNANLNSKLRSNPSSKHDGNYNLAPNTMVTITLAPTLVGT